MFRRTARHSQLPRTAEDIVLFALEPDIGEVDLERAVVSSDRDELRRMLCAVIPERICFLVLLGEPFLAEIIDRLRNLFDLAFCLTDEQLKRTVAARFVEALDSEDKNAAAVETSLFRPKYLQYLETSSRKRMFLHLLSRLQNEMSVAALRLVDGMEEFLFDAEDIRAWLQASVIACLMAPRDSATDIRAYARRAYGSFSAQQKRTILAKQDAVFQDCEQDGNPELGCMLRRLQEEWSVPPANSTQAVLERIAEAATGR